MDEFLFNDKPFDIIKPDDSGSDSSDGSTKPYISELLREMGKIRVEIVKMQKRAMTTPASQTPSGSTGTDLSSSADVTRTAKLVENILREIRDIKPEIHSLKDEVESDVIEQNIKNLLPVIDAFHRVFEAMKDIELDPQMKAWMNGIRQIYNSLMNVFRQYGVEEIEALGKPFDPKIHAAIGTLADPSKPDGIIVRIERAGFIRKGFAIRYPEVIVVRNK